jgi:hypothetical protein
VFGNDNPAVLQTLDVCICNWRPNHVKNKAAAALIQKKYGKLVVVMNNKDLAE